jgi:hypothetical protein
MLVAKLNGTAFESEMLPVAFEPTPMPAAIKNLSQARVMLITDGGLVPKGNPDRIQGTAATRWGSYSIEGRDDLRGEEYEISHGGYDARFVQEDPNRLVPLDAMREMEKRGVIGKLHNEFISTSGRVNPLANTRRLGREMAQKIRRDGVDDLRDEHSQRRCDYYGVGKSRDSRGANYLRPADCQDDRIEPRSVGKWHCARHRRRQTVAGGRKRFAPQARAKSARRLTIGRNTKINYPRSPASSSNLPWHAFDALRRLMTRSARSLASL